MKRTSLILIAAFALVMLPAAFGQSASQTQDQNAQPSATQSQQDQNTQQPNGTPNANDPSAGDSSNALRSFVGSIEKSQSGQYVLHTSGADYQLDDQAKAKKYNGKDVTVTGQFDQSSSTIRIQSIKPSM